MNSLAFLARRINEHLCSQGIYDIWYGWKKIEMRLMNVFFSIKNNISRTIDNLTRIFDVVLLYRTETFSKIFYEQQVGRSFKSRGTAILDYVLHGSAAGNEASPLFSVTWMRKNGVVVRNLADYMRNWESFDGSSPHPLFDPAVYREWRGAKYSKFGPLEAFSVDATASRTLPYNSGEGQSTPITLGKLIEHAMSARRHPPIPSAAFAVSVIVDDISSIQRAEEVIRSIVDASSGFAIEMILIPSTGRQDLYGLLASIELTQEHVRICHRTADTSRAEALNEAVRLSVGERLLFMHAGHRFAQACFSQMVQCLDQDNRCVVQPLVVDSNGLIWSAGIVFPHGIPSPWLRGISPATAEMPDHFSVQGAQFPYMVKSRDVRNVLEFNKKYGDAWIDVNLSVALGHGKLDSIEVLSEIHVVRVMKSPYESSELQPRVSESLRKSWQDLRLYRGIPQHSTTLVVDEYDRTRTDNGIADVRMRRPENVARTSDGLPRLRWSIKTAAPSDLIARDSYRWGDSYFANSLKDALVRLGQIVAVDGVENREKATGYLDDVVLNLRGYEPIVPVEGSVNVTWVISHPELVTVDEVHNSQILYAASHFWAQEKSNEWHVDIRTLLQCTDSRIFYPNKHSNNSTDGVLFVGNALGRKRHLVDLVVKSGIDVQVYGRGWDTGRLGVNLIAEHIDNASLRKLYGSASLTLNDHWPSMKDWGYMSNRTFDVVASGGRVLSDSVVGFPEELSRRMGIVYDTSILSNDGQGHWRVKDDDTVYRQRAARYVLENHTFDIRAAQIMNDILNFLEDSASDGPMRDVDDSPF